MSRFTIDTKLSSISNGYKSALHSFWTNRPTTSIEHLTKIISDESDSNLMPLYRLWIEILADQNDRLGLNYLNSHILKRLNTEDSSEKDSISFTALRGIIHCELDEIQAARLNYTTISNHKDNEYVQELYLTITNRTQKTPYIKGLWDVRNDIDDYCVFSSLIKALVVTKDLTKLKQVFSKVDNLFTTSPIYKQYQLHSYFDNKNYDLAYKTAKNLSSLYPNNLDYKIYTAYSCVKLERYQEASSILQNSYLIFKEDDLDLFYLLLYSEVEILKQEFKNNNLEYVTELMNVESDYNIFLLLSKVESLLDNNGFSSLNLSTIKSDLDDIASKLDLSTTELDTTEDHLGSIDEKLSIPTCWFHVLSDTEYYELEHSSKKDITYLSKSINSNITPSDLCFMVHKDYRNDGSTSGNYLRISAVYQAQSFPDKTNGNLCSFKLVSKPSRSIPIDSSFNMKLEPGDSFELDNSALDVLIDSISEYNEDSSFSSKFNDIVDTMLVKKIS